MIKLYNLKLAKTISFGGFILLVILLSSSCNNDTSNEENYVININKPSNFPEIAYNLSSNTPTKFGVELGRKLFYEGKMSADNGTACAFCHIQEYAFTHHGHAISHGVYDRVGFRNAPPIQNLIFYNNYTWDGVVEDLNIQPIVPITAVAEMDETFPDIVQKLSATDYYPTAFDKAFGTSEINADRILKALAQFMATMVSANSKYDKVVRNESGFQFTDEENQGKILFTQKCATCHSTDLFTDQSFRNNGLTYNPSFNDYGRFRVSDDPADKMKFRVPSLRNVELTAPYMHDGRFYTLDAVLNHYANMEDQPNLDPVLKQNNIIGIPLSTQEKQYIIAFLKTLTDNSFVTNKNFAEFP